MAAPLVCQRHWEEDRISIYNLHQNIFINQPQLPNVVKKKIELNHLPYELLFDILSRLPLTNLLQAAKYTCKLWHSLISDPMFAEFHLTHSLKNPGHLYALKGDSSLYFMDINYGGMKLPMTLGENEHNQLFSCRGLLFYRSKEEQSIYICNPVTGDSVKTPSPSSRCHTVGFGYARLSTKYKCIQIWTEPKILKGAIFTLGESWRPLHVPHTTATWFSPVYCNGYLHWLLTSLSDNIYVQYVITLDLDTEKFQMRPALHSCTKVAFSSSRIYLTVLGDNVAFVVCASNRTQIVWLLMDEVEDIWVEKYRFHCPRPGLSNVEFKLSGLWMNQDLYGMETTKTKQYRGRRRPGPGCDMQVSGTRFLSYSANHPQNYSLLQLPFAKDLNGGDISPLLIMPHAWSLLSPSKIVAAAKKPQFMVTRDMDNKDAESDEVAK